MPSGDHSGNGTGWGRPKGLAKTGGRQAGTPNKSTPENKHRVSDFFHKILDDEVEAKFWRYFMTGYQVVNLPEGSVQIIPIPLNPVAFSAFKRAVEYKRGMPVQPFVGSAEVKIQVEFLSA